MHFLDLPAEMLLHITHFLPVESITKLGLTCKHLQSVINIETLWQQLCIRDYRVESIDGWELSYKAVYLKVLQKCGFLGWQRLALMPYGGLLYVAWCKGEIQVWKYHPKSLASAEDPLVCVHLYSLHWDARDGDVKVECKQGGERTEEAMLPAKLTQGCRNMEGPLYPVIQCSSGNCPSFHQFGKRTCYSDKKFKQKFEGYENAFAGMEFHKGSNCPMLPFASSGSGQQMKSPIQLGLYTGCYGSHGVEILQLYISDERPNVLEGLKVTGDPNVPAGVHSLTVDLTQPMVLSLEQQQLCDDMLAEQQGPQPQLPRDENGELDLRQPFAIPYDCYDRSPNSEDKRALARYQGRGRIAGTYYTHPTHCNCHFVKFSDTKFGVLWLDLHSFSMFYLAKGLHNRFFLNNDCSVRLK